MNFELMTDDQVKPGNDLQQDTSENPDVRGSTITTLSCELFEGGLGI
jgi:hypothetical protein